MVSIFSSGMHKFEREFTSMVQKIWKSYGLICNMLEIWEAITYMYLLFLHIIMVYIFLHYLFWDLRLGELFFFYIYEIFVLKERLKPLKKFFFIIKVVS